VQPGGKLGVLGCGAMAEALVSGWLAQGLWEAAQILGADPAAARREAFSRLGARVTADNAALAAHADLLLVAVKPQHMTVALASVQSALRAETLVLSIAAGVTTQQIEALVGSAQPVVRAMPSILHQVGQGTAGICGGSAASAEQVEQVAALFRAIGVALVVEEKVMDAVTALAGSGPAFVAAFIEALADGGVHVGLPRAAARELAAQVAAGTGAWLRTSAGSPAELKDLVSSPGGTTIAGLRALEAGGLRSAAMEAVIAAAERSRQLAAPPDTGGSAPAERLMPGPLGGAPSGCR